MKKVKDSEAVASVCESFRKMLKSEKKPPRRLRLILALICAVVLGNVSLSFAGWEDRECVVLSIPFDLASTRLDTGTYSIAYHISHDGFLSVSHTTVQTVYGWYNRYTPGVRYVQLYYYDLKKRTWVMRSQINSGVGTKASVDALLIAFPYAKIYVSIASNTPWIASQFPNGCSDLPSHQPDQEPNLDTGDPTCNQILLN